MENARRKQPIKYIVAFCIALTTVYAKEIVKPVSHMNKNVQIRKNACDQIIIIHGQNVFVTFEFS